MPKSTIFHVHNNYLVQYQSLKCMIPNSNRIAYFKPNNSNQTQLVYLQRNSSRSSRGGIIVYLLFIFGDIYTKRYYVRTIDFPDSHDILQIGHVYKTDC